MRLIAAALAGALGLAACEEQVAFPNVPLPELGEGPITLRVARVVNPRFPSLSEEEIAEVFDMARQIVLGQFGLDVRFGRGDDYSLDEFAQQIPALALDAAAASALNLPESPGTPQFFADGFADLLNGPKIDIALNRSFVESAISGATNMAVEELANAIADEWIQGLRRWHGLRAQDGDPVIDSFGHQLAFWEYSGYAELPFEIVITNLLVASAQTFGFDVRSAIRGGMVMGATGFSRSSPYRAKTMVSTFSMVNDLGDLSDLGPDPVFDRTNATRYAAMIVAREVGYMLLHVGISWDNPSCVLYPAPPGGMGEHLLTLNPTLCPMGSDPAMTPGARTIWYDRLLMEEIERQ